jgi:hypothetical protein
MSRRHSRMRPSLQAGRRRVAGPEDVRRERLRNVSWDGARHVGVNAEQLRRALCTHHICDLRTPIAALLDESCISQAPHQGEPVGHLEMRRGSLSKYVNSEVLTSPSGALMWRTEGKTAYTIAAPIPPDRTASG